MRVGAAGILFAFALGTVVSVSAATASESTAYPTGPARASVVWFGTNGCYAAWSHAAGAHVGARAVLVGPDGTRLDTLTVRWVADEIAAFDRPAAGGAHWDIGLSAAGWWLEPLAEPLGRPSGTLTVPISALPSTLDPARMTSIAEKQVGTQLYEGLVAPGGASTPELCVADSARWDGDACRFHLRPSAYFHDGRPVRAADVVASLSRALAPKMAAPRVDALLQWIAGAREYHEGRAPTVRGVESPDSAHVVITVTSDGAGPSLFDALASPAAWILPRDAETNPAFAFVPVGSGPFRFVSGDSTGLTLRAAAGRSGGVDTLRFRRTHGPEDAALQFELGRLDLVAPLESDERRLLGSAGQPDAMTPGVVTAGEAATYYVGMNTRSTWLADRGHRRAIAAAVDRGLAVQVLVPGRGRLAHGILPPTFRLPELADTTWAPAVSEAASLRAMAPPRVGFTFWVPQGSATGVRVAEFVQAALGRQGVRIRVVVRPWPEFERALDLGQADMFYLSWFADGTDPVAFVSAMVESRRGGAGGNRTYYANARVDSLLEVARTGAGREAREGALLEAERVALSDAPLIPLFHSINVTLVRPWVHGFVPDPLGCPRYDTVEVRRGR